MSEDAGARLHRWEELPRQDWLDGSDAYLRGRG